MIKMRITKVEGEQSICPNCGENLNVHKGFFGLIQFYCTSCYSKFQVEEIGKIYDVIGESK